MHKQKLKTKRVISILSLVACCLIAATVLSGCKGEEPTSSAALKPSEIVPNEKWKDKFPEEYNSFNANAKDKENPSYLKLYPFLSTIYEGTGFAKDYNEARGHTFALHDVQSTKRINEKTKATCYSCKTPQYAVQEKTEGEKLYTTSFEDETKKITMGISCYDCHENTPGILAVNRSHYNNAFTGDAVKKQIPERTAVCAQCHNEYYFDPTSKAVKMPAGLVDPTEILAFYNSINFVDYINPKTGTEQLKAQHPEFQTFMGSTHQMAGLTCADCHLENAITKDGKSYTSHTAVNPLESESIMKETCLSYCHKNQTAESLKARVTSIQEDCDQNTVVVGQMLNDLTTQLAAASESGKYNKEQLDEVRKLNRDAQWYWDWVFVENSNGAHNPDQASDCLNKAKTLTQQALDKLKR